MSKRRAHVMTGLGIISGLNRGKHKEAALLPQRTKLANDIPNDGAGGCFRPCYCSSKLNPPFSQIQLVQICLFGC